MTRLAVFSALFVAAFSYKMQDPGDMAAPIDYSGLAGLGGVLKPPHMVLSKRQGIIAMDDDFDFGGLFKPHKPWVLSRREAEQEEQEEQGEQEEPAQLAKDVVAMLVNGTTLEELKTSAEHLKAVASAFVNETVDAEDVKELMEAVLGDLGRQAALSQLLDNFDPIMRDAQKLSVATTLLDKLATKAEEQEEAGLPAGLEYAALEKVADSIVLVVEDTEERVEELIEFLVGGSLVKEVEEATETDLQERGFHVSGGVSHGSHTGTYGQINLGYDWGKKRDLEKRKKSGWYVEGGVSKGSHSGASAGINVGFEWGKRDLQQNSKPINNPQEEIVEDDVQEETVEDRGFHVSGGVSHGSHTGTYGQINLGYDWGKKRDLEKRKKSGWWVEGGASKGSHSGTSVGINIGYDWGKRDLQQNSRPIYNVSAGVQQGPYGQTYGIKFGIDF